MLLDYACWATENTIELKPFESVQIPLSHLEQLIHEQSISFRPGDILFLRSSFTAAFNLLTEDEQRDLAECPSAKFGGIESSEATLRFLWDHQFAAVAGDAPSFERSPPVGPHVEKVTYCTSGC